MKIRNILLSIIAVLSLGLTSCTDEIGTDQTSGKPGHLSINLQTLQPKQTKMVDANATDYQTINDLNILIFDGTTNYLILEKYYGTGGLPLPTVTTGSVTLLPIQINTLTANSYVVAVANYGKRITTATDNQPTTAITNLTTLNGLEVSTINDFSEATKPGLYMTGRADILTSGDGFSYTSNVKVAPISSKITVKCNLTEDVLAWYNITGIYIVNAIDKIKLPIIRKSVLGVVTDNQITTLITPPTKTASSGLPTVTNAATGLLRDYNFYTGLTGNVGSLKDEGTPLDISKFYHYYVGENYHAAIPATTNTGALITNANANANTLIVIKATPKAGVPAYITAMADRYYTFDLSNAIANNAYQYGGTNVTSPAWTASNGFSTKRKTNYTVTFNLSQIGTNNPYVRIKALNITVEAQNWEDATVPTNF